MTNNELITELLKYDGFDYKIDELGNYLFNIASKDTREYDCWFEPMGMNYYLSDMNILHRIAVKVVDEAKEMLHKSDDVLWDLAEVRGDVISAMFTSPNPQGEHIQLATAIVNAIRYISANKAQ